ncbi:hypothetical protein JWG44_05720 [Leptospira sp. 201903071]|uniref:hypothetical protein n=1 Tax=Leptospira ainazelensis TaxID=2810034 RepID=UPI001962C715|nr:hypothetical protein [Leptospira ainazelensis]MBM9499748.1 hypothetical protein [Leptospira ainazelensis]
MGTSGSGFQGRALVAPGARGKFQSIGANPGAGADKFTLVLIGKAANGVYFNDSSTPSLRDDQRYYTISGGVNGYNQAKSILGGGELLQAIKFATFPSSDDNLAQGPQLIKFVNICPNTKAFNDFPTLKTGVTHKISFPIPGPNGKKVRFYKDISDKTIQIGDDKGTLISRKLEKVVFTVSYIGNASTALLEIDATNLKVTLTGASDNSSSISIKFSDYPTIGEVVDQINSQVGYVASLVESPEFLASNLDHIETTELVSVKAPTNLSIYADLFMEQNFIESSGFGEVVLGAVRKPFAGSTMFKYLTQGGTTGTPGTTDLKDAITFSKKISGLYRNILSSTLSDKTYFKQVCFDMISPDTGLETIGGCGADGVLTIPQRQDEGRTLGTYWMTYGLESFRDFDINGVEQTFPGYFLAVIDNAISAANSPRISPTWKSLNILKSAENISRDPAVRDACIKAGTLILDQKPSDDSWVISRSVTTERKDDLILNEKSSVATALTMVRELRVGFNAKFIGQSMVDDSSPVSGVRVPDVLNYIEGKLEYFVQQGYLLGSAALGVEAYKKNFSIQVDGDTWSFMDLEGNVTTPLNFIFYILSLKPLRGKA